jgi:hypothetical protein
MNLVLNNLCIGICTTFLHNKCNYTNLPLLLERAGVTTCMDAGGRATQEQLPRIIKSSSYIPLIPTFSLWRRGNMTCADIYALWRRGIHLGALRILKP